MTTTQKKWSILFDKCRDCGKSEHEHVAKGFCKPCYSRRKSLRYYFRVKGDQERYAKYIEKRKIRQQKLRSGEWGEVKKYNPRQYEPIETDS